MVMWKRSVCFKGCFMQTATVQTLSCANVFACLHMSSYVGIFFNFWEYRRVMQPTVFIHFVGFFLKPSSYWSSVKEGLFRGHTPQALMLLIRKAVDEENLGATATRFGKLFFVLIGLFGCRH